MHVIRGESPWVAGPISFALHAILIIAATRATTIVRRPLPSVATLNAWPLVVTPPCCPVVTSRHGGPTSSDGLLPAPQIGSLDTEVRPEPVTLSPGTRGADLLHRVLAPDPGAPTLPGPALVQGEGATDAPVPHRMAEPIYPADAPLRLPGAMDSVVVEYRVGATGRVASEDVRVVSSTGERFENAVRQALSGARFEPARRNGIAVPALVRQLFRFVRR